MDVKHDNVDGENDNSESNCVKDHFAGQQPAMEADACTGQQKRPPRNDATNSKVAKLHSQFDTGDESTSLQNDCSTQFLNIVPSTEYSSTVACGKAWSREEKQLARGVDNTNDVSTKSRAYLAD